MRSALEVLHDARNILQTKGWIGGPNNFASEAVDEAGKECKAVRFGASRFTPFGAIVRAGNNNSMATDYITAASWLKLHVRNKYHVDSLFEYNSAPDRTLEQVLADMDEVITSVKIHSTPH